MLEAPYDEDEVRAALDELPGARAVGHRIVHGGEQLTQACRVSAEVIDQSHALSELAPLHQPPALAALELVSATLPDLPAVACFDTAFHATLGPAARTYALPQPWRARWPLRRFGFHGLSHAWAARRAPALAGVGAGGRIVSCHLGAGASLCAIANGRSIDTTMGFTPLEGLVMATRSGSVDPGLVLWLAERMPHEELADGLEQKSGLVGLAGSADMREVLERAEAGEPAAQLALDVYCHRLKLEIAAMVGALGGIDVLAFTGGIGEHSNYIRSAATDGLGFLGLAPNKIRIVSAQEEQQIARHCRRMMLQPK